MYSHGIFYMLTESHDNVGILLLIVFVYELGRDLNVGTKLIMIFEPEVGLEKKEKDIGKKMIF